jgi:hypothetical protein
MHSRSSIWLRSTSKIRSTNPSGTQTQILWTTGDPRVAGWRSLVYRIKQLWPLRCMFYVNVNGNVKWYIFHVQAMRLWPRTSEPHAGERPTSRSRRFTLGKEHLYWLSRRLGGPQGRSGRYERRENFLYLLDSNPGQSIPYSSQSTHYSTRGSVLCEVRIEFLYHTD